MFLTSSKCGSSTPDQSVIHKFPLPSLKTHCKTNPLQTCTNPNPPSIIFPSLFGASAGRSAVLQPLHLAISTATPHMIEKRSPLYSSALPLRHRRPNDPFSKNPPTRPQPPTPLL
ncbi:hypothetical protein R5R35_003567 [Gryllus longicercus]|uniref:Uncharacterized protein n=1 Tax=Gryllus longicercus TaxID=2509291 RepID=A0AAN9Z2M7_9ORTH